MALGATTELPPLHRRSGDEDPSPSYLAALASLPGISLRPKQEEEASCSG